jgi:sulfoxide reductase heme-binding subunit YedZ
MTRDMRKRLVVCMMAIVMALSFGQATVQAAPVAGAVSGSTAYGLVAASSAGARFQQSWSWYVSRAAGMVAAILLALLVISGVGLLTGATYRVLEPLPAWAAHRALGISFAIMAVVHVVVLLFDKYVGFNVLDVLLPFHSSYRPLTVGGVHLGSFYVALGILALYAVALIILTTHLWKDKKPKLWRLYHYLGYAVVGLVFLHGLLLGTDLRQKVVRAGWFLVAGLVVWSIASRLQRANTLNTGD